ncbi:winged helix-turn-helix domain-containing protein [Candidatus Micrarchaeota archaeon]|jgi:DNA-binding transcriptional ArsR family regulator|nr:winged helix-turn-helix domain-containing protein [Candidatus Micrarchaeota archaeon]
MDAQTRLLYWLFNASRGGPTRLKILSVLTRKPMNTRQLALELSMDYKTIQGHLELLVSNGLILTPQKRYGSVFFISPEWENNEYFKELLGDIYGKKNKRKK